MYALLTAGAIGGIITMSVVVTYFFAVTRGSLIVQEAYNGKDPSNHIYLIYKSKFLIWLTDRQPIISAILLWNYDRLVKDVVKRLGNSLHGKDVLQLSCAFGNISEKLAETCNKNGANLVIADMIPHELENTKNKLDKCGLHASFEACDATALPYQSESFDYVISFFLFHELPLEKKRKALQESMRIVKPGGKIILAEFHKPDSWVLRLSGRAFFFVFERYAREMWHTFELETEIRSYADHPDEWIFSRRPIFKGNYFSFEAQKVPH
ncbi:MAG: methyltransferase domain-containing protein [Candidatus Azambacteria bacterium]|nr:methyltransferase domain-containing protein [Candidatus Azambacteria bacterium]